MFIIIPILAGIMICLGIERENTIMGISGIILVLVAGYREYVIWKVHEIMPAIAGTPVRVVNWKDMTDELLKVTKDTLTANTDEHDEVAQ